MQAFIFGDLFSQSFCGSLHLLGVHGHACQFGQQGTSFLETYQSAHGPGHARERRRERGVFYAQVLIARTVAVAAGGAVIVGALQSWGTEDTLDLFGPAPGKSHGLPTSTTSS